jgi:cytochrome b6-f complex iron-sulfur subunit
MDDDISRRRIVRMGALLACAPAFGRALTGCARRISPERSIDVATPVDGRVVIAPGQAPELGRAGGAIVIRAPCAAHPVLVANTGNGFLALQADCPHAACQIAWVEEDREAECPCHLSRFAGDGTVLQGPAARDLQSYPASSDAQGNVVVHLFAGDGVFPPVVNGAIVFALAGYPALQNDGGVVIGHPDGLPAPIAVTRTAGTVRALSAACTHLACTVQPSAGGVLHCPCHGSQFTLDGALLDGPATSPLPQFVTTVDQGTVTVVVGDVCAP